MALTGRRVTCNQGLQPNGHSLTTPENTFSVIPLELLAHTPVPPRVAFAGTSRRATCNSHVISDKSAYPSQCPGDISILWIAISHAQPTGSPGRQFSLSGKVSSVKRLLSLRRCSCCQRASGSETLCLLLMFVCCSACCSTCETASLQHKQEVSWTSSKILRHWQHSRHFSAVCSYPSIYKASDVHLYG